MTSRTILTAALSAMAVATLSCSKTQDTAPERRIFGDPPSFETVDEQNLFEPRADVTCDFHDFMLDWICSQGFSICEENPRETCSVSFPGCTCVELDFSTIELQAGNGYNGRDENDAPIFNDIPTSTPAIVVSGTYGKVTFKAAVTDPNSTPDQNNVLLVSSSFVHPGSGGTKTETSLVLFDDGSVNRFQQRQIESTMGEDCQDVGAKCPECRAKDFPVFSGDQSAVDRTYSRKIALISRKAEPFLADCVMQQDKTTLIFHPGEGEAFDFTLEAVDRQGNLTRWPNKLSVTPVDNLTDFTCNGDSCGCCILLGGGIQPECAGLPGVIHPERIPQGLCVYFGGG